MNEAHEAVVGAGKSLLAALFQTGGRPALQRAIVGARLGLCLLAPLGVLIRLVLPAAAQEGLQCVGDCAVDGQVTVDEIILGVSIALGEADLDMCLMFDSTHDGHVTVDELLASVSAALSGCVPNQAPTTADLPDYRTYPGQAVRIVLPGTDPDGNAIAFALTGLPASAVLDSETGVLTWVPMEEEAASYAVDYTVTDDGLPQLTASGHLRLEVLRADACLALDCNPATGCTSTPLEIEVDCCEVPSTERTYAPLEDCPGGARIEVGRNFTGFGPLQNCDALPLASQGQGGTTTKMHIAARCLRTDRAVSMRVQLSTPTVVLVNLTQPNIPFEMLENGFAGRRNSTFAVNDSTVPPAEFEGVEAQLVVTVQDADGVLLERTYRLRLTLHSEDDLPDVDSPGGSTAIR